jgi:arylsulfatase A-like enzyme
VSVLDVAPTILDAVGAPPLARREGVSLWPTLTTGREPPSRLLFAESAATEPERRSVIRWPFKLVSAQADGRAQLFDLSANPDETVDHAGAYPALREEIEARVREVFPLEPAGHVPAAPIDDATRERLRAVGYLD